MDEFEKIDLETKKWELQKVHSRERINLRIEVIFWIILAMLLFWVLYYNYISSVRWSRFGADQLELLNILILSSAVIIIPMLSKIVFGVYPLELLRKKLSQPKRIKLKNERESSNENVTREDQIFSSLDYADSKIKAEETIQYDSEEYLVSLSVSSEKLSRKLLTRSSSYLFIGSIIAFLGIVYFSFQTMDIVNSKMSGFDMFIRFLPRIGALFFIEFVAFFFLKQYRITMDDFKYYESIKRQRESNLVILKLESDIKYSTNDEKLDSIMKHMDLFRNPSVLNGDETTESIENRKFSNEELDVLNNILNQFGQLKKKNTNENG